MTKLLIMTFNGEYDVPFRNAYCETVVKMEEAKDKTKSVVSETVVKDAQGFFDHMEKTAELVYIKREKDWVREWNKVGVDHEYILADHKWTRKIMLVTWYVDIDIDTFAGAKHLLDLMADGYVDHITRADNGYVLWTYDDENY